ncbi:flagellar hook-basal body complex protein FliE [Sphingomonas sp. ac-8]|uniref:flagellar hook-basal body complex protein FliE n=1 Tax=Sphingomonas sp. ac-8 TaxID=3242977 RepID=UPI003A8077EA
MSIGALDAAAAYGRVLGVGRSGGLGGLGELGGTKGGAGAAGAGGFGAMVEQMVTDAAGSMRQAEAASARQVAGKGDLIDVVTAIGAAETALDTVVAVRDRVVNAYSDIMRLQI